MATSATGGTLYGTHATLQGVPFEDFMQSVFVALLGFTGDKVRPRWQPNPPKLPSPNIDWCAFGITDAKTDGSAFQSIDKNDIASMKRQETFTITASLYGVNALDNTSALRDGLEVSQNREAMFHNGIAYIGDDGIQRAPELINDLWYNRIDISLRFAREIRKTYNVLSVLSVNTSSLPLGSPAPLSGGIFKVER